MPATSYRLPTLTRALALLLITATFADGAEATDGLAGRSWKLIESEGTAIRADIASSANPSPDGVGGNGGCNTYGGTLTVTPDGVDITEIMSTLMACDGPPRSRHSLPRSRRRPAIGSRMGRCC